MSDPATPKSLRFGLFELDLEARELRKSGLKIKLQDQPFQILAMLLERPGETVTREELQKRLWPEDTFVDFDLSLNSAVKKLRQALGDDSENPRFIETLYRRGYRFIGPLNGTSLPPHLLLAQRMRYRHRPFRRGYRRPSVHEVRASSLGLSSPCWSWWPRAFSGQHRRSLPESRVTRKSPAMGAPRDLAV